MSVAEQYREWLDRFPKEPQERVAIAFGAIAAYEAIETNGHVTSSDRDQLVEAFCSQHRLVFDIGCSLLVKLAQSHSELQECLLDMARHKNATPRFHAIAYLGRNLPEPLQNQIVSLALSDRSFKVRGKGVERTDGLGLTDFLPQLQEMQRTETNESVLSQLAFHIPLLRDGYFVKPSDDGTGRYLSVRGQDGSVTMVFIPQEQYSERFVRKEIARLNTRWPTPDAITNRRPSTIGKFLSKFLRHKPEAPGVEEP